MSRLRRLQRAPRGSLSRQFFLPLASLIGVLLLIALLCSAAVVWASAHIHAANDRVAALQIANRDVLQDVTEAQSGLRGYLLTDRSEAAADRYGLAVVRLAAHQSRLRHLTDGDAGLRDLLDLQERAIAAWVERYASPLLAGEETTPQAPADDLFDEASAANRAVALRVDEVAAATRDESSTVLGTVLAGVVLLPLVTLAAAAMVVRRTGRAVVVPLTHIAKVLERLRAGELDARAEVTGPEEIRQIARALNSLTDENVRAGEVEADVLNQLESIDRVRTDLISTVSHELRTPLTSISGYWELLEDDLAPTLTPQQTTMMAVVRRNLDRLNELITNLLALSRAEETSLTVARVDLRAVAAEVIADVRLQAAARDITVRAVQPSADVVVVGDRGQLTRAVQNLVTNAVKFSRPGGIVEVRVREGRDEAVLEVVDEGIGIPLADLEGLGSRFYRGSNAVKAEIAGTGLGLRIVQTILGRHDGALNVESVEGEGSTFTVRLPLAERPTGPVATGSVPAGAGRPGVRD